jgi:hypothetical protein
MVPVLTVLCASRTAGGKMVRKVTYIGSLLVTLLFVATTMAVAQGNYGGSMDAREHGYQHGYRDGLRQGRADLNNNTRATFDSEDYRRADLGYEDYMGDRHEFQKGYRDGYKSGYEDGYKNRRVRSDVYGLADDAYDPDNRSSRPDPESDGYARWRYSDVAFDTGYRDGLSAAQKDMRERKEYRPEKHDSYEDADHGYHKSYGAKNLYKDEYRKGFLRGYQDTFNRVRR